MEENRNRRYNLRPLPGGRRGTPGAGAGCHSMRTTSGGGLNRRVPPRTIYDSRSNPLSKLTNTQNVISKQQSLFHTNFTPIPHRDAISISYLVTHVRRCCVGGIRRSTCTHSWHH
ncbi:unnamed protein product [Euphydryas editha]|uniref:Uncharacterized protein n=1 Tax=Euphydryas editha TaxID=104508 RepID=A0AAU9UZZ5_EUPED|nr:unnamed protein product [Euphydryas editha]